MCSTLAGLRGVGYLSPSLDVADCFRTGRTEAYRLSARRTYDGSKIMVAKIGPKLDRLEVKEVINNKMVDPP